MMNPILRHRRNTGFTLAELLVAMAVLSILLTSIAGLFYASLRSTRSGYLAAEANEEARIMMSIIERDLASAFTAREYGDYYQFYGTPLGMSFIGLARSYDPGEAQANLSRVTYVLHRAAGSSAFDTQVYDPALEDFRDGTVRTYALLRFIERGVSDLDNFPVDWAMLRSDPEFPQINEEFEAIEGLLADGWPDHIVEDLLRAKKRQVWIRILANTNWDRPYLNIDAVPRDFIVGQHIRANFEPVLPADDYLYIQPDPDSGLRREAFFQYGLVGRPTITWRPFWNAQFNLGHTVQTGVDPETSMPIYQYEPIRFTDPNAPIQFRDPREMLVPLAQRDPDFREMPELIGSPLHPRLPEVVQLRMELIYENPALGSPDFRRPIDRIITVPSGHMRTAPW